MLNVKNSFGNTPLHWATLNLQAESVKFLLGQEADTSVKNEDQQTALEIAIEANNEEMVEMIAKKTKIDEEE